MVCFYLLMLVTVANLELFNNFKTMALKLLGDVEVNPGPNEIIKSVQDSFSQGNVVSFGETASRQNACNALFSICWCDSIYIQMKKKQAAQKMKLSIKDFFNKCDQIYIFCTVSDPDHILVEGDKLYKSFNI